MVDFPVFNCWVKLQQIQLLSEFQEQDKAEKNYQHNSGVYPAHSSIAPLFECDQAD